MKRVLSLLLIVLSMFTIWGPSAFSDTKKVISIEPQVIVSNCPYGRTHKGIFKAHGAICYENTKKIFSHQGSMYECKCGASIITTDSPHLYHGMMGFYTQSFKVKAVNGSGVFYMNKMSYSAKTIPTWSFYPNY